MSAAAGPTALRQLGTIVAAFAGASLVSWGRVLWAGTARVDLPGTDVAVGYLASLAFGLLALLAARAAVGLYDRPELTWRSLAVGAVSAHLLAATAAPLTSNDLFSNLAYARMAALGLDPYALGPAALGVGDPFAALVGPRWQHTPIVYGPVWAWVGWLVGRAGSVLAVAVATKAVVLAAVLGAVALAWGLARQDPDPARGKSRFVLFALSPVLLWELSAQSHNDALVVLGMLAFLVLWRAQREAAATMAIALAAMTKLAALPLFAITVVVLARRRPVVALALVALAVLTAAAVTAPWWHGAGSLAAPAAALGGDPHRTARSIVDLLCLAVRPLGPTVVASVYRAGWLAGGVVVLVLGVRGALLARTADDVVHHAMLVVLAYCLVGTPWFHPWYVSWLLPLALVHPGARWRRLVLVYAAVTPVQYMLPLDPVTTVALDVWMLAQVRRIGLRCA